MYCIVPLTKPVHNFVGVSRKQIVKVSNQSISELLTTNSTSQYKSSYTINNSLTNLLPVFSLVHK